MMGGQVNAYYLQVLCGVFLQIDEFRSHNVYIFVPFAYTHGDGAHIPHALHIKAKSTRVWQME